MQITDLAQEQKIPVLLRLAFRPLFLGAASFSALAIAWWGAILAGWVTFKPALPIVFWHSHEMVFGFGSAVVAGFLLTAMQNWTGLRAPHGKPLALLVACWLLARLANAAPVAMPLPLLILIDLSFLPLAAGLLAKPLIAARQYRNLFFIPLLLVLTICNALMWFGLTPGYEPVTESWVYQCGVVDHAGDGDCWRPRAADVYRQWHSHHAGYLTGLVGSGGTWQLLGGIWLSLFPFANVASHPSTFFIVFSRRNAARSAGCPLENLDHLARATTVVFTCGLLVYSGRSGALCRTLRRSCGDTESCDPYADGWRYGGDDPVNDVQSVTGTYRPATEDIALDAAGVRCLNRRHGLSCIAAFAIQPVVPDRGVNISRLLGCRVYAVSALFTGKF